MVVNWSRSYRHAAITIGNVADFPETAFLTSYEPLESVLWRNDSGSEYPHKHI